MLGQALEEEETSLRELGEAAATTIVRRLSPEKFPKTLYEVKELLQNA